MPELLTGAEMRAIEQAAIDSGQVTGLALMERAGQGVVEGIFETWPEFAQPGATPQAARRALILCGPGNNGGDGFVVARLLRELHWAVDVVIYGDPGKLPPDAAENYRQWCRLGEVAAFGDKTAAGFLAHLDAYDLILDALFGTGLSRPFRAEHVQSDLNQARFDPRLPKVVAVDIPSGLCADSGRYLGLPGSEDAVDSAIMAELTVTFHLAKRGHYLADGPTACGHLIVKDIGL
ncbi:NAD(P)H-hydrate epimerase [Thalassococcus sp. S3]|uniref:NAD(P)H-hydrate epimerase n=1 Tax=Thalassococcus sp. S3 TaxID=2017482 RepID=UPI00269CA2C3